MAQTCGVYAGLNYLAQGVPIRMGFLVSTRNFHAELDWFKLGDRLVVHITELLQQEVMGVFECSIHLDNRLVASAQLTVYAVK